MNARRTAITTTAAVVALTFALATPASARPAPGDIVRAPRIEQADPLRCPITELAGHLMRCDYLISHGPEQHSGPSLGP